MPHTQAGEMENDVRISHQRCHGFSCRGCPQPLRGVDVLAQHPVEILAPSVHQVVDDAHSKASPGQLSDQFRPNETSAARYQYPVIWQSRSP